MSATNYSASAIEHTQILVSVKCSGDENSESARFVIDHLNYYNTVVINDAGRTINIRFSLDASPENCKWGPFQAHRQVYGFVYIAEAANAMEAALVTDKFNKIKEEYGRGLYHSRCLIFGIDTVIRSTHSQNVFQFSSHNAWKSIDYDIQEFLVSIFYELESKRLKMSQEKVSKPLMILAPFETPDEKNLEMDSKLMRKKCLGRHYKHLADIHLLLGLLSDSLQCYNTALDMLVSTNDSVWVGCALEGLCVVSTIILTCEADAEADSQSKENTSKFALDPRNLSIKQRPGMNWTEMKKQCIPSVKDLVDKYREAIINYSRYKILAVIELEACIKATKVFAKSKKYLEASEFIQNAVYITLNVPDSERLKRYSVMANLYKDINFHRKAFFYKRVAAMQCVAPQLKNPDWPRCNDLLSAAISSLSNDIGWPGVILRVSRELVFSLERVGDRGLANMHLLYVFLLFFQHLTEDDERDMCAAFENYANSRKEGTLPSHSQFPFVLNFYQLPVLETVSPQIGVDGVRPIRSKLERSPKSVFIYTPTSTRSKTQDLQKVKFDWCANTPCQIDVEVRNPLSHNTIQVKDFSFVIDVEADALDCPPVSFSIPPQTTSKIPVIITPLVPGKVTIVGYACQIFGVQAKCYFDMCKEVQASSILIEVIPNLPLLKWRFSDGESFQDDGRPIIAVHCGETRNLPISLTNEGESAVSHWEISCKTKLDEESVSLTFEDIQGNTLDPGKSIDLPMNVELKCAEPVISQLFSCVVEVKYAALVSKACWWRNVDLDMTFEFRRSVAVDRLVINHDGRGLSSQCKVTVTLRSSLDVPATISYNDTSGERLVAKREIVSSKSLTTFDAMLQKMKLPESCENADGIECLALAYLKKTLNLTWAISSEKVPSHSGVVDYQCDFPKHWASKMLDVPITCTSTINDSVAQGDTENAVSTGELCRINLTFLNACVSPHIIKVDFEVFQDQNNGYVEWNLEESILCLGCTSANLSISPGDSLDFPCDVVFLKKGTYVIRASYVINSLGGANLRCYSPSFLLSAKP